MKVEITTRHYDPTDRVKEYAKAEVGRIEKLFDRINTAHIILEKSKKGEHAEITLVVLGKHLVASEASDDMLKSIDLAVAKIERQIQKLKGKRFANARTNNGR